MLQSEETKNKPICDKNSCKFNVKIPDWPYERWKFSENPQYLKTTGNNSLTNSDVRVAHHIPSKVGPVFNSFLENFSQHLGIHNKQTSVTLFEQIKIMLTDSLENLGKSCKCFENCKLVQAGSTAEKTKVEAPDEFDFLILLNFFADKQYFRTAVTKNAVRIYVKDPTVIDLLPFKCQDRVGTAQFLDINLRSIFMNLFIDKFDSLLPFEWKRISDEEKEPCSSGIASTLHLWSEKFKLHIDIDLCLCVPISAEDFEQAMAMPEHVDPTLEGFFESQMLFFRYITDIMEQSPIELYAILGQAELVQESVSSRITLPFLELVQFQSLTPEDFRIKAYCLAKCILSAFLPKLCKIFGCKRCCHNVIRSYHIKNILLFMFKSYKEDAHWKEEKLPIRVLEIFSILKECIIIDSPDDESTYAAAVSTCCYPETLFLENVTNSGLYDPGSRSFFYTPDSHKPMYQLSFSPVYKAYLSTANEEADSLLKEWFENLNSNLWDAKQLLLNLFSLLKTLNEI